MADVTDTPPPANLDLWVSETHQGHIRLGFKVEEVLFSGKSPFQKVDVLRTRGHGALLLNDGLVMLTERDEFIYHEMIAHVPLFVHPDPRRVLVIGGGDGGTAREVLRHPSVERVLMIEIDEMVVDACKTHMPSVNAGVYEDPRMELRIADGVEFVAKTEEKFDVVLVDSTDPVGPATPLFDRAFYENVSRMLAEQGILITQAESPFYDTKIQGPMLANQRPFFSKLHIYLFTNLTYPGGLWSFGFASNGLCPVQDFDPERVRASGLAARWYTPGVHRAAFQLPAFVSENLAGVLDPAPEI
ncbi:MAG: polyamine aminopropyltransferase [Desulfococcaceae bacterium]